MSPTGVTMKNTEQQGMGLGDLVHNMAWHTCIGKYVEMI